MSGPPPGQYKLLMIAPHKAIAIDEGIINPMTIARKRATFVALPDIDLIGVVHKKLRRSVQF